MEENGIVEFNTTDDLEVGVVDEGIFGGFDSDTFDTGDIEGEIEYGPEPVIIGEYNLGRFADTLNLEDPQNVEIVAKEMREFREAGLTQAQAEMVIGKMVTLMEEYEADIEEAPSTRSEVMAVLSEKLTREEKAAYKGIFTHLKSIAGNIGLTDKQVQDAMQNPVLIKIMNGFYGQKLDRDRKVNAAKQADPKNAIGFQDAASKIQQLILSGKSQADIQAYARAMAKQVKNSDRDTYITFIKRSLGVK